MEKKQSVCDKCHQELDLYSRICFICEFGLNKETIHLSSKLAMQKIQRTELDESIQGKEESEDDPQSEFDDIETKGDFRLQLSRRSQLGRLIITGQNNYFKFLLLSLMNSPSFESFLSGNEAESKKDDNDEVMSPTCRYLGESFKDKLYPLLKNLFDSFWFQTHDKMDLAQQVEDLVFYNFQEENHDLRDQKQSSAVLKEMFDCLGVDIHISSHKNQTEVIPISKLLFDVQQNKFYQLKFYFGSKSHQMKYVDLQQLISQTNQIQDFERIAFVANTANAPINERNFLQRVLKFEEVPDLMQFIRYPQEHQEYFDQPTLYISPFTKNLDQNNKTGLRADLQRGLLGYKIFDENNDERLEFNAIAKEKKLNSILKNQIKEYGDQRQEEDSEVIKLGWNFQRIIRHLIECELASLEQPPTFLLMSDLDQAFTEVFDYHQINEPIQALTKFENNQKAQKKQLLMGEEESVQYIPVAIYYKNNNRWQSALSQTHENYEVVGKNSFNLTKVNFGMVHALMLQKLGPGASKSTVLQRMKADQSKF